MLRLKWACSLIRQLRRHLTTYLQLYPAGSGMQLASASMAVLLRMCAHGSRGATDGAEANHHSGCRALIGQQAAEGIKRCEHLEWRACILAREGVRLEARPGL